MMHKPTVEEAQAHLETWLIAPSSDYRETLSWLAVLTGDDLEYHLDYVASMASIDKEYLRKEVDHRRRLLNGEQPQQQQQTQQQWGQQPPQQQQSWGQQPPQQTQQQWGQQPPQQPPQQQQSWGQQPPQQQQSWGQQQQQQQGQWAQPQPQMQQQPAPGTHVNQPYADPAQQQQWGQQQNIQAPVHAPPVLFQGPGQCRKCGHTGQPIQKKVIGTTALVVAVILFLLTGPCLAWIPLVFMREDLPHCERCGHKL